MNGKRYEETLSFLIHIFVFSLFDTVLPFRETRILSLCWVIFGFGYENVGKLLNKKSSMKSKCFLHLWFLLILNAAISN